MKELQKLVTGTLDTEYIKILNPVGWIVILLILIFSAIVIPLIKIEIWLNISNWWFYLFTLPKATKKEAEQLKQNLEKGIWKGKYFLGKYLKKKVNIKIEKILK